MLGKKKQQEQQHEEVQNVLQNTGTEGAAVDVTATEEPSAAGAYQEPQPKKKKKSKKRRRRLIAIICIVALIAGAMYVRANMEEVVMAYPVTASQPLRMDLEQVVTIKGTVEGTGSAEVASSENREITAIYVKEGDQVRQGQLLASLKAEDNTDYQEPYSKEQSVRNMEAAQYNYETKLSLYEEGAIPYQDVLDAETTYLNSVTIVNSYDAPKKTEKNTIESPMNGTVTRVNAKVGLVANDTQNMGSLFVIEDLSSLKMDVQASEYNIRYIRLGQTVEISAEVLGKEPAYGVVSYIAPTGEYKAGSNNEMVVPVTIDITEAPYGLIAGVSARATILIDAVDQALTIPIDAIISDPETGANIVYLIDEGKLKKSPVETGLESDFYVEVISGLNEDDLFVANPTFDLYEGLEVMVAE